MPPELLPEFTDSGISGFNLFNNSAAHVRERMSWRYKVPRHQCIETFTNGICMSVEPPPYSETSFAHVLGAVALGTVNQVDDVGGYTRHIVPDEV